MRAQALKQLIPEAVQRQNAGIRIQAGLLVLADEAEREALQGRGRRRSQQQGRVECFKFMLYFIAVFGIGRADAANQLNQ